MTDTSQNRVSAGQSLDGGGVLLDDPLEAPHERQMMPVRLRQMT